MYDESDDVTKNTLGGLTVFSHFVGGDMHLGIPPLFRMVLNEYTAERRSR